MAKTFWIQPESTQLGDWQKQITELTGSPSFCVLPWIHLATRPNGDMRICCVANASGANTGDYEVGLVKMEDGKPANFAHNLPTEAFNNDYMKSVRRTMLAGEVPASCLKCYEEQQQGIASKRFWEVCSTHWPFYEPSTVDVGHLDRLYPLPSKIPALHLRLPTSEIS